MDLEYHSGKILSSLTVARVIITIPTILAGLLLVDIASDFGTSVGVAGQLFTVSRVVGIFASLFVGSLSLKYDHRRLLITGIALEALSAVICYLSPSFEIMIISFIVSSMGYSFILPLSTSLVREYFSQEETGDKLGKIMAGSTIVGIIGGPIFSLIAEAGGWRSTFIVSFIPLCLLAAVTVKWLPPVKTGHEIKITSTTKSYGKVLGNRSAVASLVGWALVNLIFSALVFYGPSFLRETHELSSTTASLGQSAMTLSFTLGSLVSGRMIARFNRKKLILVSMCLDGLLIILYTNLPNVWVSIICIILAYMIAGPYIIAINSLMLDQVPELRSVMMSISTSADQLGSALGAALGGFILLLFNYNIVGVILGVLSILSALIFYFLTVE